VRCGAVSCRFASFRFASCLVLRVYLCLCVCLCVCLFVCLSVCLSVSVSLSVFCVFCALAVMAFDASLTHDSFAWRSQRMVAEIKKQNQKANELVESQDEMVAQYKEQMETTIDKIKNKLFEKKRVYKAAIRKLKTKPGPPGPTGYPGKPGSDGAFPHPTAFPLHLPLPISALDPGHPHSRISVIIPASSPPIHLLSATVSPSPTFHALLSPAFPTLISWPCIMRLTLVGRRHTPSIAGLAGKPGQPGKSGPRGTPGVPGPPGQPGPQGIAGPRGAQGPAGPAGPKGGVGPVGPAGPRGVKGSSLAMLCGTIGGLVYKVMSASPP
jgi:hypothetical protein